VRDEPSGGRKRPTCVVVALPGDSGTPTNFIEGGGDGVQCSERSKGVDGGRGKISGALEWGDSVGRGKETKREEGGSGGLSSGRQRAARARGEGKVGAQAVA
jgi:hypothetical protein